MAGEPVAAARRSIVSQLPRYDDELTDRLELLVGRVEDRLLACVAAPGTPDTTPETPSAASTESAPNAAVAELVGHLAAAGGKRLRPLLVLLGNEFGTPSDDRAVLAGTAVELVHLASLHHDDVMDHGAVRHGVPSVNARWGNRRAVFAGNWLLARAGRLAAELGPEATRLHAETAERLVAGQVRELLGAQPGEDDLAHYLAVVAGKTGALIAMSLRMGAVQACAPAEVLDRLGEYGECLGTAFQISDDLLDLASPSALLGKVRGTDLSAGVTSLPILLALADDRPQGRELRELLAGAARGLDGPGRDRALALFADSPAVDRSRRLMADHLARARAALGPLPDGAARDVLLLLCDFVAAREA